MPQKEHFSQGWIARYANHPLPLSHHRVVVNPDKEHKNRCKDLKVYRVLQSPRIHHPHPPPSLSSETAGFFTYALECKAHHSGNKTLFPFCPWFQHWSIVCIPLLTSSHSTRHGSALLSGSSKALVLSLGLKDHSTHNADEMPDLSNLGLGK
ncbi:hypothetical protein Lal_00015592 [Lupinus albus]|nr:hypothetical protein Lal_00015592 [Lupinus albus]